MGGNAYVHLSRSELLCMCVIAKCTSHIGTGSTLFFYFLLSYSFCFKGLLYQAGSRANAHPESMYNVTLPPCDQTWNINMLQIFSPESLTSPVDTQMQNNDYSISMHCLRLRANAVQIASSIELESLWFVASLLLYCDIIRFSKVEDTSEGFSETLKSLSSHSEGETTERYSYLLLRTFEEFSDSNI